MGVRILCRRSWDISTGYMGGVGGPCLEMRGWGLGLRAEGRPRGYSLPEALPAVRELVSLSTEPPPTYPWSGKALAPALQGHGGCELRCGVHAALGHFLAGWPQSVPCSEGLWV